MYTQQQKLHNTRVVICIITITLGIKSYNFRLKRGCWTCVFLYERKTGFNLFSQTMNCRFKATRHRLLDIGIDRHSDPFFLEPAYESDIGVNYMSQYIKGGPEHIPEKYGHYMVNMVKYVRKYFEYKVLPDFENVKEKYYGKGQKDI